MTVTEEEDRKVHAMYLGDKKILIRVDTPHEMEQITLTPQEINKIHDMHRDIWGHRE